MTDYILPLVAIIFGTLVATIILGLAVRFYKGKLSEASLHFRLFVLVILALGVAVTILSWMSLGFYFGHPLFGSLGFLLVISILFSVSCGWIISGSSPN